MSTCPNDKIINPKTGRCVSRKGSIGRSILSGPIQQKKSRQVACPNDKIINPKTGKCVSRTGSIGRSILSGHVQSPEKQKKSKRTEVNCPNDKIINPKTGRCVSRTGSIGRSILDAIPKPIPPKPKPIPPKPGHQNQPYEEKYPHMNKITYHPSYRPHQPKKNATPTPTKYSPMDGNYVYEKIEMVPIVNKITSIQPGNTGSFEYISYYGINQVASLDLRHTRYAATITYDMEEQYAENKDLKVKQTEVDPQHYSYYLNPEMYHMGQPYFLGFIQPTRNVCYIHAALNALAFSPLAPRLKTFLSKLGVYGTYSSDLQIATVLNDRVYSILSAHTDDIYSGGHAYRQYVVLLEYMRLSKGIPIIQSYNLQKQIKKNSDYIILNHSFKEHRASTHKSLMDLIKRNKLEILCGTIAVKTTSYFHAISCCTHNGIKCLIDPNDLVRVPYDWTVYDEPKLQQILNQMKAVDLHSIVYVLRQNI